jgi:tRNA pseudouridine32 synthase/23S rRNA pseudouridine746 synthase
MGRQAEANAYCPLPMKDGVAPSFLWVPDGARGALLPFLAATFPLVTESSWVERMARGDVVDGAGARLEADTPLRRGMRLWYYREVEAETPIPFEAQILHMDEHLLVADKPHFLPMTPGGRFVQETLLTRLKRELNEPKLTPIHRLDRETAGVVIFSRRDDTRGIYQSMFQKRSIRKVYEAVAPAMPQREWPFTYRSRMVESGPFFLMREEAGEPNSETLVDVIATHGERLLYRLEPHTGRKHQLRVHMAALGAPILNDAFYPVALPCKGDDFSAPLKLLARSIAFEDPLTGEARSFASLRSLLD